MVNFFLRPWILRRFLILSQNGLISVLSCFFLLFQFETKTTAWVVEISNYIKDFKGRCGEDWKNFEDTFLVATWIRLKRPSYSSGISLENVMCWHVYYSCKGAVPSLIFLSPSPSLYLRLFVTRLFCRFLFPDLHVCTSTIIRKTGNVIRQSAK